MTVKVKELAKELNMESSELIERIRGMGIAAESETSEIGDMDAVAARNTILRSRAASETKIVKAAPKKNVREESEESSCPHLPDGLPVACDAPEAAGEEVCCACKA